MTAVMMLFVWLLTVGMGMANACLANEDHARHGHLHHHDVALADQLTAESQLEDAAQLQSPATTNCQKLCAGAQSSMLKQQGHEPGMQEAGPV